MSSFFTFCKEECAVFLSKKRKCPCFGKYVMVTLDITNTRRDYLYLFNWMWFAVRMGCVLLMRTLLHMSSIRMSIEFNAHAH